MLAPTIWPPQLVVDGNQQLAQLRKETTDPQDKKRTGYIGQDKYLWDAFCPGIPHK